MGLASTSHFVWNVALTEAGPSVCVVELQLLLFDEFFLNGPS